MRVRLFILPFVLLLLYFNQLIYGQPVQFIQQDDLLSAIPGFADYADCVVDMNGDFLDDIVRIGGKGVFIDFQKRDGAFDHQAFHIPILTLPSWSICAGDIDNNGYNDLLLAGSASVSFVRSDANGFAYEEMVMPGFIECQRSTMFDINQDGLLDAFVCNEEGASIPYRNAGNGEMIPDPDLLSTVDLPGNYAAIWTDYNNDGHADLYITKCLAGALPGDPVRTNLLYKSNGDGTFTEVGLVAGVDDNAQSWSTSFEDFDHDGDFDAFVVNHDFENRLYRNNGDGTFTDVITSSGINPLDLLAFENSTGDFNNDGHMDIFAELQNRLYLGHGDLTFTGQSAPSIPGAIGDLNQDGFLDIVHHGHVWLNAGNGNHWLNITPFGIQTNRNGIGARVELYGQWGLQVQEVRSGQSYSPMSSLNVHFGLGENTQIDSLIVRWSSGIVTRKKNNFQSDTSYIIPEANSILPSITLASEKEIMICEGDTVILAAPANYSSYLWSNGVTTQEAVITSPGNYFVMAFDGIGNAAISNTIHIEWIRESIPEIMQNGGVQFCHGDTLLLSASSAPSLHWSTGDTSLQIKVAESGVYQVIVDAVCSDGLLISSPLEVTAWNTPAPIVSDVMLNAGDSIELMASGENIHWYDEDIGGDLLHIGSNFQTPVLNSSTTYYVESQHLFGGENQSGGKFDTTGNGGLPTQGGYLNFESWQPFMLQSVSVYIPIGGPEGVRFVQLRSSDTLIAFKQFTVHEGWNELNLDFHVDVGKYILDCPQGNLFRNSGNVNYPYSIGQVGKITGSAHGDQYYYYFYNWKIKTDEIQCTSERVPIHVIITGEEQIEDSSIFLYPNPAKDYVSIQCPVWPSSSAIKLFDTSGRQYSINIEQQGTQSKLNVANLQSGIYFLQIQYGKKMFSAKILLQ